MSTSATQFALADSVASYFRSVAALDIEATMAHFAPTASLTVQTDPVTYVGSAEIRRMFQDFFSTADAIAGNWTCVLTNVQVDLIARKVSTEQDVALNTDNPIRMHNCNFFDFADDGRFSRVIVWMGGPVNPLRRNSA